MHTRVSTLQVFPSRSVCQQAFCLIIFENLGGEGKIADFNVNFWIVQAEM